MLNNTTSTTAAVLDFSSLVSMLDANGSCRFVSLLYRAKPNAKVAKQPGAHGELARHTIMLNVNRERMLRRDVAVLMTLKKSMKPGSVQMTACDELIASLMESIVTPGDNSRYTKKGYYEGQGNGNLQVSVKQVAYVRGYTIGKEVLEKGTPYPPTKSAEKTIEKDKLRKHLKSSRCREFAITPENFLMARAEGKAIVVDATGTSLAKVAGLPPVTLATPVSA